MLIICRMFSLIKYYFLASIILIQFNFAIESNENTDLSQYGSQNFITGNDGVVRIYVNVLGHVKKPGVYLVYDGIDIISLISLAGGPLPGARLKNVKKINKNSNIEVNIQDYFNNGINQNVKLLPNDTIYIEQSNSSYILTNSNLFSSSLQVLTLLIAIFQ